VTSELAEAGTWRQGTMPRVRGPLFCGAKLANRPGTCRAPSGRGTSHPGWGRCNLHGGSTESHEISAALDRAEATARLFGVPREVDPLDGMLECYHRTAGMVDAIEAMCVQLLPADVVWGLVERKSVGAGAAAAVADGGGEGDDESLTPPEEKYAAGVNLWVRLLAEWHDRMFTEGERILKLGLDTRRLELSASHVAAMVTILLSPDLALSDDQRRVVARMLRTMEQNVIEGATT
jgi:hypothetical protein